MIEIKIWNQYQHDMLQMSIPTVKVSIIPLFHKQPLFHNFLDSVWHYCGLKHLLALLKKPKFISDVSVTLTLSVQK